MAIKVTYPDGRTIISDRKNKKTEYNAKGNKVIRVVKEPVTTGGYKLTNFYDLSNKKQVEVTKNLLQAQELKKAQDNYNRAAEAVITSLQASAARTQARREGQVALLKRTVGGRNIVRMLDLQAAKNYYNKIKNAPYNDAYKQEVLAYIRQQQERRGTEKNKGYGVIKVGDFRVAPESRKEARYLKRLSNVIARDQKLKQDWNNSIRTAGLAINRGDKWYLKAYKGAGTAGLAFLSSGKFIGNAGDKLLAAISGLGVGKKYRQAIGEESLRAAKATPKALASSFDPRKPENWANIILVAISVNALAQTRLAARNTSAKNVKATKTKAEKALVKVKQAKKAASKNPRKNANVLKKLRREEKALIAKKAALEKRLKVLQKQEAKAAKSRLKIKVKPIKPKASKKSIFAALKKKMLKIKDSRQAAKTLKLARKSGLSRKQLAKLERLELKARRAAAAKEYKTAISKAKAKGKASKAQTKKLNAILKQARKNGLTRKQLLQIRRKYGVGSRRDIRARRAAAEAEFKKIMARNKKATAKGKAALKLARRSGLTRRQIARLERLELRARRAAAKAESARLLKSKRLAAAKAKRTLKLARRSGYTKAQLKKLERLELRARRAAAAKEGKNALKLAKAKGAKKKALVKEAKKLDRAIIKAYKNRPEVLRRLANIDYLRRRIEIVLRQIEKLTPASKAKARIIKATSPSSPKVVEIQTANGLTLLLAAPETVKAGAVKVPTPVLKGALTYYSGVLATARAGKPFKLSPTKVNALHKKYYPVFKNGDLSALGRYTPKTFPSEGSGLGVSPFSKIGDASRLGGKSKSKLNELLGSRSSNKQIAGLKAAQIVKIAVAQKIGLRQLLKYLQLLELLRVKIRRFRKIGRLKLPRLTPKRTRRLTRELDEFYTKTPAKYRPSFAAIIFGIYGYRPKTITGFELRPILKKRRTVKKRRRRKVRK